MSEMLHTTVWKHVRGCLAAAFCAALLPGIAMAQQGGSGVTDGPLSLEPEASFVPFPLALENQPGGLRFDPAANDRQSLQLQLSEPVQLQAFGESLLGQRGAVARTGSAMNYRITDNLGLQGGMSLQQSTSFQSLGSIHCQNGTLDAVSYRASNCYFIDDAPGGTGTSIALGASYDLGENARAALNLYQERGEFNQTPGLGMDAAQSAALLDPLQLGAMPGNDIFGDLNPALLGLQNAQTERTGVDVEFQVGISTDQAGDLVLGLQLTRVLDSGVEGVFYSAPGSRNWTIAEPFDAARLSLDWQRGSFGAGIDSYYRSPVSFLDRQELDSSATFDVHFTWRAPWNASLSVGASNLLGAGADDTPAAEGSLSVDPFESIYGRIPYVRYKQDL